VRMADGVQLGREPATGFVHHDLSDSSITISVLRARAAPSAELAVRIA
jgi:hypothetical protein